MEQTLRRKVLLSWLILIFLQTAASQSSVMYMMSVSPTTRSESTAIFCVFYSHHDSPRPNQRIRNAIFCIFYSHHKGLKPNRRIRNDNIY
ncbi:uncharacterized protein [Acropora muricata]|uniref:uncharacterized protein isoform X9 n=1 Tax=Acropora muricata TaxID=159855 RepID=UPI0034E3988F